MKLFFSAIINSSLPARAGLKLSPRFMTKLISYPFSARESVLRKDKPENVLVWLPLEIHIWFYRDSPANLRDMSNLISLMKFLLLTLTFCSALYLCRVSIIVFLHQSFMFLLSLLIDYIRLEP